ncbi:MAG: class I SAM-dependent methyltransferase [Proteobacteria bacterium]|nr:class I SAM-dependent methyltransferase [Pseudomonadota bacterium]
MPHFKFAVQPQFAPEAPGGLLKGQIIHDWLQSQALAMSDAAPGEQDFTALSERLLLSGQKDFLIWDDLLKAAEMSYFADQTPLKGPSIDFCCGFGFWTSRILGKIDVGVDLFPEKGAYARTVEEFVSRGFIGGAYRSVLQADVTGPLPLPDDFFESIISVCSLEHIERADKVLATMARILKPGGRAYFSLQTGRYIETFEEIFHPDYVNWVRESFTIHVDRTWREWEDMLGQAGLTIEHRRFVLSEREMKLKALTYWKNPFAPVLGELELGQAVKDIPEFRRHYYDKVRQWSRSEVDPDEASIVCFTCRKKS